MPAPDFELDACDGSRFRLEDTRGRHVLVAMLRNARCAVCNLWLHETAEHALRWRKRGLDVVPVFETTIDRLRPQLEGRVIPFPVLADPDGAAHERYASVNDPERVQRIVASGAGEPALRRAAAAGFEPVMEDGANFFRIPSETVVDPEGRVVLVHRADAVSNHLPIATIEELLLG